MSYSPLVSYVKLSPNCTRPRRAKIDTITIHCMAGDLSVEACGDLFANPNRDASSNYGIGSDGRIACYVDEINRSWCSSNSDNDHRAITIEVANTKAEHPWPVSDAAYRSLINLLVDICQRNAIPRLLWKGDKSLIGQVDKQNMTVHRWFAAKACPGDYLYNLHSQIAQEVNARLNQEDNEEMTREAIRKIVWEALEGEMPPVYTHLSDVPDWGRDTAQKLVDKGILKGTGNGELNLDYNTLRVLVINDRAGLYG